MNLTQFFDASIKLQNYGYKIHFIEEDGNTYCVTFAYADVCSGLAFGGVQYVIQFHKGCSIQSLFAYKMVAKKLNLEFDSSKEVSNMDEAIDFIITDIQEIEAEEMKKERQKILDKLTPREREVLGV